jgi:hypothetical protein
MAKMNKTANAVIYYPYKLGYEEMLKEEKEGKKSEGNRDRAKN